MPTVIEKSAIGVGSPIIDILAHIPEEFIEAVGGGKGGMQFIEPKIMDGLVEGFASPPQHAPGGSAANTIFGMARLGVPCAFLGKIGNDDHAHFYKSSFEKLGGDITRFKHADGHSTARCLSLITPDSERTMRTHLGAAALLSPEEIDADDFEGFDLVHVEGYILFNPDLASHVLKSAKDAGCQVSLDLGAFEVVKAAEGTLPDLLRNYVDIVFANEDEAEAFCGHRDYAKAVEELGDHCETAAVKLGAEGSLIKRGGESTRIDATPVSSIVDTTGAGDLWAAGYLFGHLLDKPIEECGRLGSILGGEVVQHIGADLHDDAWARVHGHFHGEG